MWDGAARVVTLGKPNSTGRLEGRIPEVGQDEGAAREGGVALPGVLRWFWALSVTAFLAAPVVAFLEYRAGMTREYWDPLQHPIFADLLEYVPTFRLLHSAAFFNDPNVSAFAYPPFSAVLFELMYSSGHPVALFVLVSAIAFVLMFLWVRSALMYEGIGSLPATALPITLAIVSFPLARLLPQGNIEMVLWILVLAGIALYRRGQVDAAAVCWGLAAATKLYPLAMLLLFVRGWRWRAMFVGMVTFVASTWLSLMYIGPTLRVAFAGSLRNVLGYQDLRVGQWNMNIVATNHSLFTLVKAIAAIVDVPFQKLTLPYYLVAVAGLTALYVWRVRRMPFPNQVLTVSLYMVMVPTVSYFHTLVHLYAAWFFLAVLAIRADRKGVRVPGLSMAIMLCLPLFVPYTLYSFRKFMLFPGLIEAIVLVFLLLYSLQYRFEMPGGSDGRMEENGARA